MAETRSGIFAGMCVLTGYKDGRIRDWLSLLRLVLATDSALSG